MRGVLGLVVVAALAVVCRPVHGDEFKLEEGFTLLFNGKNLDGWKMKKGGEALDGKTEAAKGRFKVKDGMLIIDPKVKGDLIMETKKTYGKDAHIKFDFKPDAKCNNDLFFRGQKFDIKKGDVKNFKPGEWHTFEIIVTGDKIEYKCNGQTQKKATLKGKKPAATTFGIRAEFGGIEFKNIRIKE